MDNIYDYVPYPEIYNSIEAKVEETVESYFEGYDTLDRVSQNEVDILVDDIYRKIVSEIPEIEDDAVEVESKGIEQQQLRPYYGRRRLLRDLIGVILIGNLLRRGRGGYEAPVPYYPDYGYPNYGYPVYGYSSYGYDNSWYGQDYSY